MIGAVHTLPVGEDTAPQCNLQITHAHRHVREMGPVWLPPSMPSSSRHVRAAASGEAMRHLRGFTTCRGCLVAWAWPFGSGVLGQCVAVQRDGPHPRDHPVRDEVQQKEHELLPSGLGVDPFGV
jgi:hypothetical protein